MKLEYMCYICLDVLVKKDRDVFSTEGKCACKGSVSLVHKHCLLQNLKYQLDIKKQQGLVCSICKKVYQVKEKKTRRYTFFYTFPLWYTLYHCLSMLGIYECVTWGFDSMMPIKHVSHMEGEHVCPVETISWFSLVDSVYRDCVHDTSIVSTRCVQSLYNVEWMLSPWIASQLVGSTSPHLDNSYDSYDGYNSYDKYNSYDGYTYYETFDRMNTCMSSPFSVNHMSHCTLYGKVVLCWSISCFLHFLFSWFARYVYRRKYSNVLYSFSSQNHNNNDNVPVEENPFPPQNQLDNTETQLPSFTIIPTLFSLSCYLHFLTFIYFFIYSPLGYIAFVQFCAVILQIHWDYHHWYEFAERYYEMEMILHFLFSNDSANECTTF